MSVVAKPEVRIKGKDDTKKAFNSVQKRMKDIAKASAALAGVAGIGAIAVSAFNTIRSFEKMEASLKTVTGSSVQAALAMDMINKFAAETPFQVSEITSAFIKLKGLGLDPSEEAIRSYGNTAAAMGKSLNQFIEAVADASTNEFERLKEFGIKAKQQGDKVSFTFQGVTTTIGKNSAEITKFLQSIGQNQFATGMSDQMDTLDGRISNLLDSIDRLFVAIGKAGVLDILTNAVARLALTVEGFATVVTVVSGELAKLKPDTAAEGLNAMRKEFEELIVEMTKSEKIVSEFGRAALFVRDDMDEMIRPVETIRDLIISLADKMDMASVATIKEANALIIAKQKLNNVKLETGKVIKKTLTYIEAMAKLKETIQDQNAASTAFKQHQKDLQSAYEELRDPMEDFNQKIALQTELFNLGKISIDDYSRRLNILVNDTNSVAIETDKLKQSLDQITSDTLTRLSSGIGDAFADFAIGSKTANQSIKELAQSIKRQLISTLVQVGVQQLAIFAASKIFSKQSKVQAAIEGPAIATAYAPAAAATSIASFGSSAISGGLALAATFGLSKQLAGQAHDGLDNVPRTGTYLLEKGEAVIKKSENQNSTQGRNQGGKTVNINFNINTIDTRTGTQFIISQMPRIKREISQAFGNNFQTVTL